jgi:hypothetical protein
MKKCEIRVKMTSPSEERIRTFGFEDPGRSDFISASSVELEAFLQHVHNPRMKIREGWIPAIAMDKKHLLRKNLAELRRAKRIGGILCVCEADDLPPCCIKEIVHYENGQVIILAEKYSHARWRVPRVELEKTSLA